MEKEVEKKHCKILGFKKITRKEDMEEVFIINVAVYTYDKDYNGMVALPSIYLKYNAELKEKLELYLLHPDNFIAEYEITANIITGRSKITNIKIEEV